MAISVHVNKNPGCPEVATDLPLFHTYSTLHSSEVLKSVSLLMGLGKCHGVVQSVNAVYTSLYIRPIKEAEYACTLFLHFLSTWELV